VAVKVGRLRNLLLLLALAAPAPALADPSCFGLCSVDCVKPISIPDRWDDNGVPGSVGWANNGVWDREIFSDTNGNGLHDPGEPFIDGSSAFTKGGAGPLDGIYSAESYDPLNTGYVASKDSGLEITLRMGAPSGASVQTQYYPLDLPNAGGGSTAAERYGWNWANCNPTSVSITAFLVLNSGNLLGPTAQALRSLIDQDPGAYWDDGCQCVNSALGNESPRLIILTAHDPRIPINASGPILVTKLIGLFIESADVNTNVRGRLVQIHRTGDNSCATGGDFIVDCAVPTQPVTWGAIKGIYR
jgi:hypothetical protein